MPELNLKALVRIGRLVVEADDLCEAIRNLTRPPADACTCRHPVDRHDAPWGCVDCDGDCSWYAAGPPNGCLWCAASIPPGHRYCSTEHERFDRQFETTWRKNAMPVPGSHDPIRDNHTRRFSLKCGNRLVAEAILGQDRASGSPDDTNTSDDTDTDAELVDPTDWDWKYWAAEIVACQDLETAGELAERLYDEGFNDATTDEPAEREVA